MSDEQNKKEEVLTPYFRGSFVQILEPKSFRGGKPFYSIQMIFPKDADLSGLRRIAQLAAKEGFPKGLPEDFKSPFKDGNKEKKFAGKPDYKDTIVVSAKSLYAPGIVDQKRQEILDPKQIYSGAWYRAVVNAFAYVAAGNKGVSFGLLYVQKVKDDTPLGGRANPSEVFETIEGFDSGPMEMPSEMDGYNF